MKTQVTADKQRQSCFVSIFEAFVWPNGNEWLNGNTFNYYWEARSACTAWRGLSPYKAPWTQSRSGLTETAGSTWTAHYSAAEMKKAEKQRDLLLDYEWVDNCFNMRFSVLTLLWFSRVQLHVADTLSLIGHSLFTGFVKDAVLYNITLTCAGSDSQWKRRLSVSSKWKDQ